jgi:hypothetical protein
MVFDVFFTPLIIYVYIHSRARPPKLSNVRMPTPDSRVTEDMSSFSVDAQIAKINAHKKLTDINCGVKVVLQELRRNYPAGIPRLFLVDVLNDAESHKQKIGKTLYRGRQHAPNN